MSSVDSLSLELERQSALETSVALASILISGAIPWILPFAITLRGLLTVVAATAAWAACWRIGLIGAKRRILSASWDADGRWWLTDGLGRRWSASLTPGTRRLGRLTWLHWHSERGSRQMLYLAGFNPRPTVRRLAVRLRLQEGRGRENDPSHGPR